VERGGEGGDWFFTHVVMKKRGGRKDKDNNGNEDDAEVNRWFQRHYQLDIESGY
jgi:hypothetical protein